MRRRDLHLAWAMALLIALVGCAPATAPELPPVPPERSESASPAATDGGPAEARACAPAGWTATTGKGLDLIRGSDSIRLEALEEVPGLVVDPWFAFREHDVEQVTLPDGTRTEMRVSVSRTPRQTWLRFEAGGTAYVVFGRAEPGDDLSRVTREVALCAQPLLAAP